jgi:hypothetical protein
VHPRGENALTCPRVADPQYVIFASAGYEAAIRAESGVVDRSPVSLEHSFDLGSGSVPNARRILPCHSRARPLKNSASIRAETRLGSLPGLLDELGQSGPGRGLVNLSSAILHD